MYSQVKNEIISKLLEMPEQISSLPGEVFSSGLSSIKEGNFYLLGLNPGGGGAYPSIRDHIVNWSLENYSAFTQQCWNFDCWEKNCYGTQEGLDCHCVKGTSRHQEAVRRLVARCGDVAIENIFATNAVFAKSSSDESFKSETGYTMRKAFDACWPLHVHLMSIIKPKIIICLGYQDGGSPFSLLQTKAKLKSKISSHFHGGRAYASFKWASVEFNDSKIPGTPLLVGVRHPSWVVDAADCDEFESLVSQELYASAGTEST